MEKRKIVKKKNKTKKRYKLSVGLYLIVSFCAIFYIAKLQIELAHKNSHLNDINKKIVETQNKNESTKSILNSGNEGDVIQKIAREEFNYVLPDERVFYDISGN